jgi:hypothetical protein
VPCGSCSGTASCSNMALGPCSKNTQAYWQDHDGDGYGNPLVASVDSCTPVPGFVTNGNDCDDSDAQDHPGATTCQNYDPTVLTTCPSSGATVANSTCANGCAGGQCKNFGTVSVAGTVTCGATQCSTSQGCSTGGGVGWGIYPSCGAGIYNTLMCDGPNDCPGQICTWHISPGDSDGSTNCAANDGSCPSSQMGYSCIVVCDPSQPSCPNGTTCKALGPAYMFALYVCE